MERVIKGKLGNLVNFRELREVREVREFSEQLLKLTILSKLPKLHKPPRQSPREFGWLGIFDFLFFFFPMKRKRRNSSISLMWVISKVLFGCIVISTLIKTVTLTYNITDILIIILSIYISCECIFSTTLRTCISC